DYEEERYGTDPNQKDSDNDGLWDGEEVEGWRFVYALDDAGPRFTWVTSDPLKADTDGDEILDKLEAVYGFHPRVASELKVLSLGTEIAELFDLPGTQPCATLNITGLTVNAAQLADYEVNEGGDAEIAIEIDGQRIWYGEGYRDGDPATLNVTYGFCNRDLTITLTEIDQGDWNNDPIGTITVAPDVLGSRSQVLRSPEQGQGSEVTLTWNVVALPGAATVRLAQRSDNIVRPGQTLAYTATIKNELLGGMKNEELIGSIAHGLFDVDFPAAMPDNTLYNQPFKLGPSQQTTMRGYVTIDDAINTSQVISFTQWAGALIDPNLNPQPRTVGDVITPTFWLKFDESDPAAFVDASAGGATIELVPNMNVPEAGMPGLIDNAARFTRDVLRAWGSQLNLNTGDGHFTLSAWIFRENAEATGTIMGYADGGYGEVNDKTTSYPTLFTSGDRLGAYFGTGTAACEFTTNVGVLSTGEWQHVLATYDGVGLQLYVDGILVGNQACPGYKPYQWQTSFWIGRASSRTRIGFDKIVMEGDEGDGLGNAEIELYGCYNRDASGGSCNLARVDDMAKGDTHDWSPDIIGYILGDSYYHVLTCEADWGTKDGCNGTDDRLYSGQWWNYEVGSYVRRGSGGEDLPPAETPTEDLALYFSIYDDAGYLNNTFIDDLRVYKQAVTPRQVVDLVRGANLTLETPFNEPPGAVTFHDYSGNALHGSCQGSACPLSGLQGRSSQAIRFDGDNDKVTLFDAEKLRLTGDAFVVAAWVRGDSAAPDGGAILASNDNNLILAIAGGVPSFQMNGSTIQGGMLQADTWYHVAWVYEQGVIQAIYVDGVQVASTAAPTPLSGTPDIYAGYYNDTYYTGYVDQLSIIPSALQAGQLATLRSNVPQLHYPFNEGRNAISFADDAAPGVTATCPVTTTCPTASDDAKLYGGLVFDGDDDLLPIPNAGAVDDDYSVALWLKPLIQGDRPQDILSRAGQLRLFFESKQASRDFTLHYNLCGSSGQSTKALNLNQWNHVVLVKSGASASLYLNGTLDSEATVASCGGAAPLEVGGTTGQMRAFYGELDELSVYGTPISAREVEELYQYQEAWFDTNESLNLTVDAEDPTVNLLLTTMRLPNRSDQVLQIDAADVTSGIASVEYKIDRPGVGTVVDWTAAGRDAKIWLMYFTPSLGAGDYTISLRATDRAGYTVTRSFDIVVDATPPVVTITDFGPNRPQTTALATATSVSLSGSVSDGPGSVVTNTMRIELFSPEGFSVAGPQTPAVNGTTWTLDYQTPFRLNGVYSVALFAEDFVGNVFSDTLSLPIDGTPPTADVMMTGANVDVITGSGASPAILYGTVSDIPYRSGANLNLHFEMSSDTGSGLRFFDTAPDRNDVVCLTATCPTTAPGNYGQALAFDGSDYLAVNDVELSTLDIEGQIALAAWIRPTATDGERTILSQGPADNRQVVLRIQDGQYQLGVIEDGTAHITSTAVPAGDLGQWIHLAGTYDGEAWRLYRNGTEIASLETDAGAIFVDSLWLVGAANAAAPAGFFQGDIDEVLIYARAISVEDIRQLAVPVTSELTSLEVGLEHLGDGSPVTWHTATIDNPFAAISTWSLAMPDLEGPYRMHLRVADIRETRVISRVWEGEVDTVAPRVTLHAWNAITGTLAGAFYACEVEDYNLDVDSIVCPAPIRPDQVTMQDAPWFLALYGDIEKPFQVTGDGAWRTDAEGPHTLQACDFYGNCASTTVTTTLNLQSQSVPLKVRARLLLAPQTPDFGVWIAAPQPQTGYTTLDPITIGGGAVAASSLQDLTVYVNGAPVHTQNWADGATTAEAWTTLWTPPAPGIYTITATLTDWAGGSTDNTDPTGAPAGVQVMDTVIYVDVDDPQLTITTAQVDASNYALPAFVTVTGQLDDAVGVKRLEVKVNGSSWQPMRNPGATWQAPFYAGTLLRPDGVTYTLSARAFDFAGHVTWITQTVPADAQPPAGFTPFVSYDGPAGRVPLAMNETIQDVLTPTLHITWTASSDPSGLAPYQVELLDATDPALPVLQGVSVPATAASFTLDDIQKLKVRVTAVDTFGNRTARVVGPFYTDYHTTPAYVDMAEAGKNDRPYRNWLDEPCNALGKDKRIVGPLSSITTLGDPQRFYATWNGEGLRFTWTGAHWDRDGDLFIYLDTEPGAGSPKAHNPFSNDTVVWLPALDSGQMEADWMIHVQGSVTATLARWNGGAWAPVDGLEFAFGSDLETPHTDLF
ncbi:MAG: LamG-like jellyroll fold domain-containing protein, partial [Anaerolineae bacterium]